MLIINTVNRNYIINKPLSVKIVEKISLLFPKKIENNDSFTGFLVLFNRNGDLKIFNKHYVLTRFASNDRFELLNKNYEIFSKIYKTPLIKTNYELLEIMERHIEYFSYDTLTKENKFEIIKYILSQSLNSYKIKLVDNINIDYLVSKYKKLNLFAIFPEFSLPKTNDNYELKFTISHGDLNFNNILFNKNEINVIDFENVTESFALYDFINLIFVEGLYHNDYSMLNEFMSGNYDEYINNRYKLFIPLELLMSKLLIIELYICERIIKFELTENTELDKLLIEKYRFAYSQLKETYYELERRSIE